MGPRADFSCNSKKCQQIIEFPAIGGEPGHPGTAAMVYQDLPIDTKFCPACGSKRITRLYNHVNTSRGIASGVDRVVQPVADEHDRIRASARAGEARGVTDGSGQRRASFMQPISAVTGVNGAQPGGSRPGPSGQPLYVADDGATMRPVMKPTTYAAVDRESRPA